VLAINSVSEEPSVFDAGRLDISNPYGLTKTEKYIYKNKKNISSLKNKLIALEGETSELKNLLDGFRTVSRGGNERIYTLKNNYKQLQKDIINLKEENKSLKDKNKNLENELKAVKNYMQIIENNQTARDKKYIEAISAFNGIVDNINSSYVDKAELKATLDKLLKTINKTKKRNNKDIFNSAKTYIKNKELKKQNRSWSIL